MKKIGSWFTILMLLFSTSVVAQTTYFIDQQNGQSSNNGTAYATAFASINTATSLLLPGDTVVIIGVYKNPLYNPTYSYTTAHDSQLWHGENSIRISHLHGTSAAYITIKAYDSSTLLQGDGANIFRVQNSSFLRIQGFEIAGEVPRIPITTANALQFVYINVDSVADSKAPMAADIQYRHLDCISNCTAGAVVDGEIYSSLANVNVARPSYIDTRGLYLSNVHHIDIIGNTIHDMPGGGLRVSDCEDITIQNNEVYACSRKSYSGTHALVVTKATSTRTTNDYRIVIANNTIHHNYNEQYSWAPTKTIITPHIDEGKGISLQRNETTYHNNGTFKVNWEHGRILVQNNICYFNGFSGIHSNDGHRIDIINNTCYFNSYTKSITQGIRSNNGGNIGISAQGGGDIAIFNNISIIDSALSKSAISSNIPDSNGLVVENNLIFGTSLAGATGTINENANVVSLQLNTQKVDPLFVDPVNFDFSLQANSPAIDAAQSSIAPSEDFFQNLRDNAPDIGAIEYLPLLPIQRLKMSTITIYPNPVDDVLYTNEQALTSKKITLCNMLGQDFTAQMLIQDNQIQMSNVPRGQYILSVDTVSSILYKK
ncbi:MAG: T9SS type A sorting domain-containing protein [Aureispira sp.]